MKKALITGVAGQDGSYLAEYLLSLDYEVHGILKNILLDQKKVDSKVHIHIVDIRSESEVSKIVAEIQPDEIYNLAAVHTIHHRHPNNEPTRNPQLTLQTNAIGVLNLLEASLQYTPQVKFFQAGSSEIYGNAFDEGEIQSLTTPMHPTNLYGCAKLLAYNIVKYYRTMHNLHACNGILFNHESPRRGTNFVTGKIVKAAVEIKKGIRNKLEIGNLDSSRDWGHSKDYVRAMHMIVNYKEPREWIIATGISRSVRDLCSYVFGKMNMNYENYVVLNSKYIRSEQLKHIKGDPTEIRIQLGWEPNYTFEMLLDEMIEYWMEKVI